MEELVDVLDERGMYTGKTETRVNCGKEGCWEYLVKYYEMSEK
ncbi:unknown [Clostridium sp. CAG:389]|mgnify:FL=1|nr:unknown [Clostridium sp. CAG:389]